MKARFAFALGLGSLVAMTAAGRAEVEFAGYMRTPQGEARFVLTDPAAQKTSEWIAGGGSFAGYRVTGFEAKSELLAVEKDGVTRQLRLKSAAGAQAGAGLARERTSPTREEKAAPEAGVEKTEAEMLKMLTEVQNLLAEDREALRQRAAKLREKLPEGHPELLQIDADLAKYTQRIERNQADRNRILRSQLLKKVRDAGSPEEKARLEDSLRAVEARLAKAGAAVDSAPGAR